MTKLVLASSSPARRKLLERLAIPFVTMSPDVDETPLADESPEALARRLAISKAQAVSHYFPKSLIIGSDQVIVIDGKMYGKPLTHENAVKQLQLVRGHRCEALTGLCVLDSATGKYTVEVIPFTVVFRDFSDEMIENYLRKEQPYHCAGGIKAEGLGIVLFDRLIGDDPNSLEGLPLIRLVRMLEQFGMQVV